MTAKRQIESSINSGTMLDGTGGHVTVTMLDGTGGHVNPTSRLASSWFGCRHPL